MATTVATFAGLDGLYTGFRNQYSVFNGYSNLAASGASGMRKIKGAQKVPSVLPQPNRKYIKGDDGIFDNYMFAADSLPGGMVEVGTSDLALDAAALSATNYTLGNWLMGLYGPSNPSFLNMVLLGHQQSHSQDSGSVGNAGYMNHLWPNVQLFPLGGDDPAYQNEGKDMYGATFIPFTTTPWGAALSSSNFTLVDGIRIDWWSQYRTFIYAVIGDDIATSFTVDHTPVNVASTKVFSTVLADGSSGGTSVPVTTVTPSSKTVSIAATVLASTKLYVCIYEASKL